MDGVLARAMTAYAELPARLLACTSPLQFWAEYLRFGRRLFSGFQFVSPAIGGVKRSTKRVAEKKSRR
jgi:hypothetical protein